MSHFSTLVLSRPDRPVEELLLPYMENCCSQPPFEYMEFFDDEECDVDDATGRRGYWQNPDAHWDWYVVGGRFSGMLRSDKPLSGGDSTGRCDSAFARDCDFSDDHEAAARASEFWRRHVVEGEAGLSFFGPEYYMERYGDVETFARMRSRFCTHAVVTTDGSWHEVGAMGWWGASTDSGPDEIEWADRFRERFLADLDDEVIATVIDCHI